MSFDFDQFYRINRRILIWLALLVVLWLLNDFFHLIFVTFVLTFVVTPLVKLCEQWLRLPYRIGLAFVYVVMLIVLVGFIRFVTPGIIDEANQFAENLGQAKARIVEIKQQAATRYPNLNRVLRGYLHSYVSDENLPEIEQQFLLEKQRLKIEDADLNRYLYDDPVVSPEEQVKIQSYYVFQDQLLIESFLARQVALARDQVPRLIKLLYQILETLILSLLFSFLILNDKNSLRNQLHKLEQSRLRDFYRETAKPISRFSYVIGRGIQAQGIIALANTVLTMIGLFALSIPTVGVLTLIVFVCGIIPVVGTFISTVPILLVALNTGGPQLAFAALLLIFFIHVLEAYFLNPLIYGRQFKLNPVLVLIILFVGYHLFGIWGVLLGVPITQYFMHHVFGIPVWREDRLKDK